MNIQSDSPGAATTAVPPAGRATNVKVCGIVEPRELEALAAAGVDFVGLWYGVTGGPHDLPLDRWVELAGQANSDKPAAVLVTFAKNAELLREALERTGARWVQLHGYQTPGLVRRVKAIGPEVRVIKVLHVRNGACDEAPLFGSYERAGVDVFLFDAVSADGRLGSTGETLEPDVVLKHAGDISKPFLLAGGISDANRDRYAAVIAHPNFLGIDVDTNARGVDGKVSLDRVVAITEAWRQRA